MAVSHLPLHWLRERRELANIRASEMANRLGMQTTSYNRMERGERRCYLDKAIAMTFMLGCTLNDLISEPTEDERLAGVRERERVRALERRAAEKGVDPGTLAIMEQMDAEDEARDNGTVVSNTLSAAPTPKPKPVLPAHLRPTKHATQPDHFIIQPEPEKTAQQLETEAFIAQWDADELDELQAASDARQPVEPLTDEEIAEGWSIDDGGD